MNAGEFVRYAWREIVSSSLLGALVYGAIWIDHVVVPAVAIWTLPWPIVVALVCGPALAAGVACVFLHDLWMRYREFRGGMAWVRAINGVVYLAFRDGEFMGVYASRKGAEQVGSPIVQRVKP